MVFRVRFLMIVTCLALILALGSHTPPAFSEGSGAEVIILSSSTFQGELAPCG